MFTIICAVFLGATYNPTLGNMVLLEKSITERVLKGYDPNVRPYVVGSVDSPTRIKVNIFISDIFDVNDFKMDYTLQVYLRETWMDPRLMFPDPEGIVKNIPISIVSKIWTPDLFFNEREGKFHSIQRANKFIRIYPYGMVYLSSRLTLKLHCPMNFKYFPFDKQICTFQLESYGYTTKDIELIWAEGNPIQVNSNLHMSNFILEDFDADYCGEASQGAYSCLKVSLLLKRQYGFYLTQLFIPFVILVAVSWLSLWLDPKAMTLRLSLLVIVLFMMVILTTSIHALLPSVSYTKAIDIWTAVSLSFVFGAFLEFMLVNQLARRERTVRITEGHVNENGTSLKKSTIVKKMWQKHISQHIPPSKRIDFTFRVLFPTAFVLFNCIFWLTYIKSRDNKYLNR